MPRKPKTTVTKPAAKPSKTTRKTALPKALKPSGLKNQDTETKNAKSKETKSKHLSKAAPQTKTTKTKTTKKKLTSLSTGNKSSTPKAQLISSVVAYEGPLFRVLRDELIDPSGHRGTRDVIRHNGSVVILAVDASQSKRDPWIVMERQYRHAANQFLWELPAGKLDAGEVPLTGAQRELEEETGYHARKWKPLVEYYASPGFLGESMKVFLAEGLIAGHAHPEEDEEIEFRLVKLSDVLKAIDKGTIIDGKTLTSVLLYARKLARKKSK